MAAIDALLRLLVQHEADELHVEVGKPVELRRAGEALPVYLPTVTEALADQLLAGLRTVERQATVAAEGRVVFHHALDGLERFTVQLDGTEGRRAWIRRGEHAGGDRSPGTEAPADPRAARRQRRASDVDEPPALAPVSADPKLMAKVMEVKAGPPSGVARPPVGVARPPAELDDPRAARRARREAASIGVAVGAVVAPDPAVRPEVEAELIGLLRDAAARDASDLHVAVGENPTIRVDGRLRSLGGPLSGPALLAGLSDGFFDLPDGARVRVHAYDTAAGRAAALRMPTITPELTGLGHPVPLGPIGELDHGLVVLGGPAGSGKTTTLAALVQHRLRARGGVVVTLEDPVEVVLRAPAGALVRQRQIGRDVPDAATGLREALRHDPDVIVISELRDPDAILLALTAAETGHLVLTTLHCRSAASGVDRILDAVPPARQAQARTQLAASLAALVVQRLLPGREGGRVLAAEVVRASSAVSTLVREGRTAELPTVVQTSADKGMVPLERHLAQLVRAGRVDEHDARIASNDPSSLLAFLRAADDGTMRPGPRRGP